MGGAAGRHRAAHPSPRKACICQPARQPSAGLTRCPRPLRPAAAPPPSYGDVAPYTVENFAALALSRTPGGVGYAGSTFHRVVEGFMIQARRGGRGRGPNAGMEWRLRAHAQVAAAVGPCLEAACPPPTRPRARAQGGDVMNNDGTGSFTVWDGPSGRFKDENLGAARHVRGALSMANYGPDTNGAPQRGARASWRRASRTHRARRRLALTRRARPTPAPPPCAGCQFFITTADAPWCDGAYQVLGRVLDGMDLVEGVSRIATGGDEAPMVPVVIRAAGEIVLSGAAPAAAPAGALAGAPAGEPPAGETLSAPVHVKLAAGATLPAPAPATLPAPAGETLSAPAHVKLPVATGETLLAPAPVRIVGARAQLPLPVVKGPPGSAAAPALQPESGKSAAARAGASGRAGAAGAAAAARAAGSSSGAAAARGRSAEPASAGDSGIVGGSSGDSLEITNRVYLDLEQGGAALGRVVIGL